MGRILALDYGTKRIGVAVSDETKKIAIPLPFILAKQKKKILDLISEKEVEEILLGLPKGLSGKETQMTKQVRSFAVWLQQHTDSPIRLVDERFSTREAKGKLRERNLDARRSKSEIDSMSAFIILQTFLTLAFDKSITSPLPSPLDFTLFPSPLAGEGGPAQAGPDEGATVRPLPPLDELGAPSPGLGREKGKAISERETRLPDGQEG